MRVKPTEPGQNSPRHIEVIIPELLSELSLKARSDGSGIVAGLPTGFKDLDALTSGLRPGSICVIAGRPSMGQSLLALNIASHVTLKEQLPVMIFSMEMSASQVAQRLVGIVGGINPHRLMTGCLEGGDFASIEKASKALMAADVMIDETPGLTVKQICSRTRELCGHHKRLGLVVIDDLQQLSPAISAKSGARECGETMSALRGLAQEINTPIIVLSQLKRRLEKRKNKRPYHSDLPAIQIAQYADLLVYLYRDEVYNRTSQYAGTAEIIVGRNRYGSIGATRLAFSCDFLRFYDFPRNPDSQE